MASLSQKKLVVIGGSRGVGRQVVIAARCKGARVLAVARESVPLQQLAREAPQTEILALDAADEDAPARVFAVLKPDMLVISAGAFPPAAPLHQLSWEEFAGNWETDVKIAFHFCKAALAAPLSAGASVVLIASGAALAGSPNSGGYAGAKRTQMFIANYAQKESDRMGLGLQFTVLAPRMMPESELGKHAVAGYARYLGISAGDFVESLESPPTPADVANATIQALLSPEHARGKVFVVSGRGLEAVG
jgi:NAD(P)-dependent dehydrogenase (short-subunit alcohol dehydrogenase family)